MTNPKLSSFSSFEEERYHYNQAYDSECDDDDKCDNDDDYDEEGGRWHTTPRGTATSTNHFPNNTSANAATIPSRRGTCRSAIRTAASAVKFVIDFLTRNGQLVHATPIGPPADANELEYVSALHQCSSMAYLRGDGSVTAEEISVFLKSRHGLRVRPDVVRNVVIRNGLTADLSGAGGGAGMIAGMNGSGSGGRARSKGRNDDGDKKQNKDCNNNNNNNDDDDDDDDVVDVVELAAMLVIPNLLRMRYSSLTRSLLRATTARTTSRSRATLGGGSMSFRRKSSESSINRGRDFSRRGVDGVGNGGGSVAESATATLEELAEAEAEQHEKAERQRLKLEWQQLRKQQQQKHRRGADDVDMIRTVLSMIIEDCTGDAKVKPLNEALVRDILRGYGEGMLAEDDDLVRGMVEVASVGWWRRKNGSGAMISKRSHGRTIVGNGIDNAGGIGNGSRRSRSMPGRLIVPGRMRSERTRNSSGSIKAAVVEATASASASAAAAAAAALAAAAQEESDAKAKKPLLDVAAFVEALTGDVARTYDPGRYDRHSTNFQDVWEHGSPLDVVGKGYDVPAATGGAVSASSSLFFGSSATPAPAADLLSPGRSVGDGGGGGGGGGRLSRRRQTEAGLREECPPPPLTVLEYQPLTHYVRESLQRHRRRILACFRGRRSRSSSSSPPDTSPSAVAMTTAASSSSMHPPNDSSALRIQRLFTGQAIDYSADTYRTRSHIFFIWTAFAAFWFAYLRYGLFGNGYQTKRCGDRSSGDDDGSSGDDARRSVMCPLVAGIVNQLLMITELVVFGAPFIVLGSAGNSIEGSESTEYLGWGVLLFALYVVAFYAFDFKVPYWISTIDSSKIASIASLAFGLTVVGSQAFHIVMLMMRKCFGGMRWYRRYFQFGNVGYEAKIKRSGLYKVDRMLRRAHELHRSARRRRRKQNRAPAAAAAKGGGGGMNRRRMTVSEAIARSPSPPPFPSSFQQQILSNFGMALNEYIKMDGMTTKIGGIGWTWSRIWDGTLFTKEGIWISGRVAVGTVFQVLVIFATPTLSIFILPQLFNHVIDGSFDREAATMGQKSKIALGVGIFFAFTTSVMVTILFIPTMVATTLKFRRGVLPSLRSEDFLHRYRFALDQTSLVYGGMFWGVLFSSIAIALITGGFVYILLWEETSAFVLGLVGNLLGLSVVLITKLILMQIMRFTHYSAFYRRKPLSTNMWTVVVECYSIGISVWFMVVRSIKIVLIAALYMGRIDTPLFASGVGIFGPLELDNWPTVTRKEILIHEAHRHPYLETLGYLYMMQLRHRTGFAKRACSAWRLIFVLALMPWLHKYRDLTRPEHFGEQGDDDDDELMDVEDDLMFGVSRQRSGLINPSQLDAMTAMQKRASVFRSKRILRQAMVSSRWLGEGLVDSEDLSDVISSDTDSSGMDRIGQIKQEIRRLQKELWKLESKESGGVLTPDAKATCSFVMTPLVEEV